MRKIFFITCLMLSTHFCMAQRGLLLGMGISYGNGFTADLQLGYKNNATALYYNQVAFISSEKPAYFGLATGYDVLVKENYKLTLHAGYYYRLLSTDVKGRAGGNYSTWGAGAAYNQEWFSITARYLDGQVQAGILFSGLLTSNQ